RASGIIAAAGREPERARRGVAAAQSERSARRAAGELAADGEVRGSAAVVAAVGELSAADNVDGAAPGTRAAAVQQLKRALSAGADAGHLKRFANNVDAEIELHRRSIANDRSAGATAHGIG